MNFITMNMFVPHIWASEQEKAEHAAALAAGWSTADILWERLMTRSILGAQAGNTRRSKAGFTLAAGIAKLNFKRSDIRRATAHINLALLTQKGNPSASVRHCSKALDYWSNAKTYIDTMSILPRSRSSLFHLRLEALHRDTFRSNMTGRLEKIASETRESIKEIKLGGAPCHRHFSRWKGEKPPMFDDTRKVLAACLLILETA